MTVKRRHRRARRTATGERRFWRIVGSKVPAEVRVHLGRARREILLAVRAVVDGAVARGARSLKRGALGRSGGSAGGPARRTSR